LASWLDLHDLKRLQAFFSRLAHIKLTPSFLQRGSRLDRDPASNDNPLGLVERGLVAGAVVELGRAQNT
jgi:hypothetical protein